MADSPPARLSSAHLEDLAVVALTAIPGDSRHQNHPPITEVQRTRLRSRLKQIGRHNWPASLKEDPLLRQGYTLRQCIALTNALLLIDAQLPPSAAIPIAANNELGLLRLVLDRLRKGGAAPTPGDRVAVVLVGQLWEQVDLDRACISQLTRVRTLERSALPSLWSDEIDLAVPGQRLIIDAGRSGSAVWSWLQHRRLLPAFELDRLIQEIDGEPPAADFIDGASKIVRR